MSTITFDTFKNINRLKEAGVPEKQAIAEAEALSEAVSAIQWVTKQDLQLELAPVKAEITLLKWIIVLTMVNCALLLLVHWIVGFIRLFLPTENPIYVLSA